MPTEKELLERRHKPGRPILTGTPNLAFVRFRNIDGTVVRVTPAELDGWERLSGDPLEGHRADVARRVRDGKTTIVFDGPAPVGKGERFHVGGSEIVVLKVTAKKNKRSEERSEVLISRLERDKVYLLRQTVPAARPGEVVGDGASPEDAERARIDGNYTSSAAQSDAANGGTDAGEAVPPEWEDVGVAKREVDRQEAVKERMTEERVLKEATNAAARVKQEIIERGANGEDLTHLLADIYGRLAEQDRAAA